EGDRGRDAARGRALEEHVRARVDVVAVRAFDQADDRVPRSEVRRETAGDRGGERQGAPRRLRVRRDDRVVRGHLRGEAGEARAGDVPQNYGTTGPVSARAPD